MIVLTATVEQKEALEGFYENGTELRFIQDANDNWVVNIHVIENGSFLEIREELQSLPQIVYQPKIINI